MTAPLNSLQAFFAMHTGYLSAAKRDALRRDFESVQAEKDAELDRLRAELDERKRIGAQLATAAFNLSQPEQSLTNEGRNSLKALQRAWDAIGTGGQS